MHRRRIEIIDTTLRDGEQQPGLAFSCEQKVMLAERLAKAGVDEIEAGTPIMGGGEAESIRAIVDMNLPCRVTGWCRADVKDLNAAEACGLQAVHFSLPASSILMDALGWSLHDISQKMLKIAAYARQSFQYVSVGLQDVSRAEMSVIRELVALAAGLGVDRIRLADSVGVWSPLQVARVISELRPLAGRVQLAVHMHNDLGMAVGNSIAALEAEADSVDVTAYGIGERAGNAALEQVAAAVGLSPILSSNVNVAEAAALASDLAGMTGQAVATNRPIVGSRVFTHESGIHVHAMLRDSRAYEPCEPSLFGHPGRQYVIGKHSGKSARVAYQSELVSVRKITEKKTTKVV